MVSPPERNDQTRQLPPLWPSPVMLFSTAGEISKIFFVQYLPSVKRDATLSFTFPWKLQEVGLDKKQTSHWAMI